MTTHLSMLRLTIAAAGVLAIIPLAGCGGSSTNGDTIVTTAAADPYIYAYGDNGASSGYGGTEVSAFGTGSAGDPLSTDVAYFTFASANSAPTSTEAGAGEFEVGLEPGVTSYAQGTYVPAVPAGSGSVIFRAQAVQGQTTNRTVPNITAATLSLNGGTATSFTLPAGFNQATAAGPFAASPYYVATPAFSGITASGVYPATATITDAANRTTSTSFEAVALAGTDGAIAAPGGIDASGDTFACTIAVAGGTPTVTYGPDASGTSVVVLPPGTYSVTVTTDTTAVGTASVVSTYTANATVTSGEVYIAPTAAPAASGAARKHARLRK